MISFVWSEIGFDAGETPEHVVIRKEAERLAGSGEFWWGALAAPLGISVERMAERNGGSLPALFSKSRSSKVEQRQEVRIWDTWRSLLHPQQHGRIPDHVVVTSGHDPGRRQMRYALNCHSGTKLTLGAIGFCNLAECYSLRTAGRVNALPGAQALRKAEPLISRHGRASEAFTVLLLKLLLWDTVTYCSRILGSSPKLNCRAFCNSKLAMIGLV
jgi:hypothetical protein